MFKPTAITLNNVNNWHGHNFVSYDLQLVKVPAMWTHYIIKTQLYDMKIRKIY